jgi:hypothetical protein
MASQLFLLYEYLMTTSPFILHEIFPNPEPVNLLRNRFPDWRASTTTLFIVPACQPTQAGGIDTSESIPGLHKRLQIRAQRYYHALPLLDAFQPVLVLPAEEGGERHDHRHDPHQADHSADVTRVSRAYVVRLRHCPVPEQNK